MARFRLEFTVEPFVDGRQGPHVRAAIDAVAALGLPVDIGPFGTAVDDLQEGAIEATTAMLEAALGNGATRVSIQVTRLSE